MDEQPKLFIQEDNIEKIDDFANGDNPTRDQPEDKNPKQQHEVDEPPKEQHLTPKKKQIRKNKKQKKNKRRLNRIRMMTKKLA